MSDPLKCAVCHVELTTADADDLVRTDEGPVHRECFDGPVPPPAIADDVLIDADEEEAARAAHGDVPLPFDSIAELPDGSRVITELKTNQDFPEGATNEQVARYRGLLAGARGHAVHDQLASALAAPAISDDCRARHHGDCPTYKPCGCPCHAPAPDDGLDRYDPEDDRSAREQRDDDANFGRYSEEGRTY